MWKSLYGGSLRTSRTRLGSYSIAAMWSPLTPTWRPSWSLSEGSCGRERMSSGELAIAPVLRMSDLGLELDRRPSGWFVSSPSGWAVTT